VPDLRARDRIQGAERPVDQQHRRSLWACLSTRPVATIVDSSTKQNAVLISEKARQTGDQAGIPWPKLRSAR
jgi:hypothetical protein